MRMVMIAGDGNDREGFAERRPPEASDRGGPRGFAGDAAQVGAYFVRDSTLLAAGNCAERCTS